MNPHPQSTRIPPLTLPKWGHLDYFIWWITTNKNYIYTIEWNLNLPSAELIRREHHAIDGLHLHLPKNWIFI